MPIDQRLEDQKKEKLRAKAEEKERKDQKARKVKDPKARKVTRDSAVKEKEAKEKEQKANPTRGAKVDGDGQATITAKATDGTLIGNHGDLPIHLTAETPKQDKAEAAKQEVQETIGSQSRKAAQHR